MHDITVAILAQGTHSGRCGNAGLLPSIGCFPQAGAAATQAYCQALAAFPGGVRAPGGQERKVAKVHKNVIIVKVFWDFEQGALGYKPQVIHESEAKIAQKLNGALQKCSK